MPLERNIERNGRTECLRCLGVDTYFIEYQDARTECEAFLQIVRHNEDRHLVHVPKLQYQRVHIGCDPRVQRPEGLVQ